MSRRAVESLVIAALILAFGVYEWKRDRATSTRTAAATSTAVHEGRAAVERAGVAAALPGVAATDSTLSRVLARPRPRAATVNLAPAPGAPLVEYVTRAAYDSLGARLDSTTAAAAAYRDSVRVLVIRYPRLVAELDSVTRFQRVEIATPAPRRRCGFAAAAGYAVTYNNHRLPTGPALVVGVGCSL